LASVSRSFFMLIDTFAHVGAIFSRYACSTVKSHTSYKLRQKQDYTKISKISDLCLEKSTSCRQSASSNLLNIVLTTGCQFHDQRHGRKHSIHVAFTVNTILSKILLETQRPPS
jgi:hypothetical protein